jgi:hypothetical protein
LEKISIPTTEVRPTKETDYYLYKNHEKLNIKYRDILRIDESKTAEDIFIVIQNYMLETQGQPFIAIRESLIGIAAIVGTVYVDVSNGCWQWDIENNICWVANREKYPKKLYPLSTVIICWREKVELTLTILKNEYKWIT